MRVFEIAMPTKAQARQIVRTLFDELLAKKQNVRNVKLSPSSMDALVGSSPRQMRQALEEGLGHALYDGRKRVQAFDLPTLGTVELPSADRLFALDIRKLRLATGLPSLRRSAPTAGRRSRFS